MNNMLSYCGLVNAKIRASDKELPLLVEVYSKIQNFALECTDVSEK